VAERDAAGQIVRWFGTNTDIDEQRRAIRSRDELLATVSHDLRNPLGAIMLATESLRADGVAAGDRRLGVIERSSVRMNQLIQDLLDMASIESGHLSVEPSPLGVRELVDEAVEAIQLGAAAKRVVVETRLEVGAAPVHGDRRRVLQVLGNILGNVADRMLGSPATAPTG